MELQFLGAAGTVTGSRYLLRHGHHRVLVDCGLFQGVKRLRERNRAPFPVDPSSLHAVVLSHAHLDHSGWLPALVRAGFHGPVYCTPGTAALAQILLRDAAKLQMEDADYANRKGFSRHHPAEPLYTLEDAEKALDLLRPQEFGTCRNIDGLKLGFRRAGHIIGASSVSLAGDAGTLLFSGDVGRSNDPVMRPPLPLPECDWLVTESTYGNRLHPELDYLGLLASAVTRCAQRGGVTVLPAFAVGRAQMLLHLLLTLQREQRIPDMPIFLDSPMASKATRVLSGFPDEHRLSESDCRALETRVVHVDSVEESKALAQRRDPHIIVSASGMATGGRVLHHLKRLLPDPRHQVIFVGFQAPGTRGDALVHGTPYVKMHGEYVPVRATVHSIDTLSAHADQAELLAWLATAPRPPRQVFVTHGEPEASDALRLQIRDRLGWPVLVPEALEKFTLR
ncbi:MAG: fold metallo-hydrolase [Moraxellaceae bacterium]|nr:fold metallo-hydrolase [Moraxellaceae bacterium]